jgi:uncharacterized protein YbaR (Trm112 family)
MVDEFLLSVLRCPMNPGGPALIKEGNELICGCGVRFAIVDDIPNMLIEEAKLPEGCGSINELPCQAGASASQSQSDQAP